MFDSRRSSGLCLEQTAFKLSPRKRQSLVWFVELHLSLVWVYTVYPHAWFFSSRRWSRSVSVVEQVKPPFFTCVIAWFDTWSNRYRSLFGPSGLSVAVLCLPLEVSPHFFKFCFAFLTLSSPCRAHAHPLLPPCLAFMSPPSSQPLSFSSRTDSPGSQAAGGESRQRSHSVPPPSLSGEANQCRHTNKL